MFSLVPGLQMSYRDPGLALTELTLVGLSGGEDRMQKPSRRGGVPTLIWRTCTSTMPYPYVETRDGLYT